jgi:hypothetical protein
MGSVEISLSSPIMPEHSCTLLAAGINIQFFMGMMLDLGWISTHTML